MSRLGGTIESLKRHVHVFFSGLVVLSIVGGLTHSAGTTVDKTMSQRGRN